MEPEPKTALEEARMERLLHGWSPGSGLKRRVPGVPNQDLPTGGF